MVSVISCVWAAFAGAVLNFAYSFYRRRRSNPNRPFASVVCDSLLEIPMMLKIGPWATSPDIHAGMKLAMKETGLSDFGAKSTFGFVQRYNTATTVGLVKSKGKYTPFGHYLVLSGLVRRMRTRLQLIDYLKKHPVVLETKLKSPIFVVGFTRTGSTFLHEMLALNEHVQTHYTWEQYDPIPTTHDESLAGQKQDRDKKYKGNKGSFDLLMNVFFGERMQNIHRIDYDAPEECTTPCAIGLPWSISGLPFNLYAIDELIPLGAGDTFAHYRTFLQLLTWQAPERRDKDLTWMLKCPFHLPYLDALHREFPDATIVWTHRDPAECIASACSLYETLMCVGMDEASIDRAALGRAAMHYTHRCLEVAEQTIARLGEKFRIMHVRYRETLRNPKETCKRVYKMAGVPYTDKYDAALDAYLQDSEQKRIALKQRNNSAAVHVYRPEDYGLSAQGIREEFAAYIAKYC